MPRQKTTVLSHSIFVTASTIILFLNGQNRRREITVNRRRKKTGLRQSVSVTCCDIRTQHPLCCCRLTCSFCPCFLSDPPYPFRGMGIPLSFMERHLIFCIFVSTTSCILVQRGSLLGSPLSFHQTDKDGIIPEEIAGCRCYPFMFHAVI